MGIFVFTVLKGSDIAFQPNLFRIYAVYRGFRILRAPYRGWLYSWHAKVFSAKQHKSCQKGFAAVALTLIQVSILLLIESNELVGILSSNTFGCTVNRKCKDGDIFDSQCIAMRDDVRRHTQ